MAGEQYSVVRRLFIFSIVYPMQRNGNQMIKAKRTKRKMWVIKLRRTNYMIW